jgi:hypothetical protein
MFLANFGALLSYVVAFQDMMPVLVMGSALFLTSITGLSVKMTMQPQPDGLTQSTVFLARPKHSTAQHCVGPGQPGPVHTGWHDTARKLVGEAWYQPVPRNPNMSSPLSLLCIQQLPPFTRE